MKPRGRPRARPQLRTSHPLESNQNLPGFDRARRPSTREWETGACQAPASSSFGCQRAAAARFGRTSGLDAFADPAGAPLAIRDLEFRSRVANHGLWSGQTETKKSHLVSRVAHPQATWCHVNCVVVPRRDRRSRHRSPRPAGRCRTCVPRRSTCCGYVAVACARRLRWSKRITAPIRSVKRFLVENSPVTPA